MGWGSGSSLFGVIMEGIQENVSSKEKRKKIYAPIFAEFKSDDWDTDLELVGIDDAYDEVRREYYLKRGWTEEELA